ncbi:hypothetical protein BDV23DRAFT_173644 [Aspergillus alliaceus]|uniref:Myb-like DNA-binding domain-containing protein n=1 Tax=Petromyces alliaceus TaxID=209559 RepID=A0A5N6FUX3_PETAA|nr:uncharacterized protein BDW43DRAFT_310826 [Aspergillus alliaceus]KAB8233821.1 hypothetical protein BDW43DRAFT_310826 [Aspergillus alliaceus]KAE8388641.1 hypothetical protein BDV23DRAFT_173644 [Aspergillus alliaceus]
MPPKSKPDDHLVFLYLCLVNSAGVNNIDFSAVAEATHINVPAARMRWSRLKARIEKEMAIGPEDTKAGEPSAVSPSAASTPAASPAKTASPAKKRGVKWKKINEPEDDGVAQNDGDNKVPAQSN